MSYPSLSALPSPPPGKTRWPWTEETPETPETMPDGNPWPRVSVVTPSYNQGKFIEETIRSVLLQGYPNLEYIIIDGGSTDESFDVIEQYEPWLAHWVSEPDRGQSQAINKGLRRASGEIVAYLNSDDMYLPETIREVVEFFIQHEDIGLVYGDCQVVDEGSHLIYVARSREFDLFAELCRNFVKQPTVFMRRKLLDLVGYFDEELHYALDIDYWFRAAIRTKFAYLPRELAIFRMTSETKTGKGNLPFTKEREKILERFFRLHAYSDIKHWKNRVLAWHYYRAGSQLYADNELVMAREKFIKSIKLAPFCLKALLSLLAIVDMNVNGHLYFRVEDMLSKYLQPSQANRMI
jgi:glycosyltransferase involved in cell wall biosynthesis